MVWARAAPPRASMVEASKVAAKVFPARKVKAAFFDVFTLINPHFIDPDPRPGRVVPRRLARHVRIFLQHRSQRRPQRPQVG